MSKAVKQASARFVLADAMESAAGPSDELNQRLCRAIADDPRLVRCAETRSALVAGDVPFVWSVDAALTLCPPNMVWGCQRSGGVKNWPRPWAAWCADAETVVGRDGSGEGLGATPPLALIAAFLRASRYRDDMSLDWLLDHDDRKAREELRRAEEEGRAHARELREMLVRREVDERLARRATLSMQEARA